MSESEEKPNPYILNTDQRTMPSGLKKNEQKAWVEGLIAIQREGVDNGIRPQNLFIPQDLLPRWNRLVWSYYRKSQTGKENRAITEWSEGRQIHTQPQTGGTPPTPMRFRDGQRQN